MDNRRSAALRAPLTVGYVVAVKGPPALTRPPWCRSLRLPALAGGRIAVTENGGDWIPDTATEPITASPNRPPAPPDTFGAGQFHTRSIEITTTPSSAGWMTVNSQASIGEFAFPDRQLFPVIMEARERRHGDEWHHVGSDEILGRISSRGRRRSRTERSWRKLWNPLPDEIEVQLGIKVRGTTHWLVAMAALEGRLEITLTWHPGPTT